MKKIIIKSIELNDFKGVNNLKQDFHAGRNYISGMNGAGKTTLAESIAFALTGSGLFAEKILNEPIDKNGNIKENFVTKIALTIEVDGELYTIKREYSDQKRVKNTLKFMSINDKPFDKKRDFDDAISKILGLKDKEFQAFSNPKYLNSLANKDAREFIISLVESKSDVEIINNWAATQEKLGGNEFVDRVKVNITKDISLETQLEMKTQEVKNSSQQLNDIGIKLNSKSETLTKISALSDDTKDVESLNKEKARLEAAIADVHTLNSKALDFEKQKSTIETEIERIKSDIKDKNESIQVAEGNIKSNKIIIEEAGEKFDEINLKPVDETCSICGSVTEHTKELGEKHKHKALDEIENIVKSHIATIRHKEAEIKEFKKEIKLLEKSFEAKQLQLSQLTFENKTVDVTELQRQLNEINETLANDGSISIIKKEIEELNVEKATATQNNDALELEKYILDEIFKFKAQSIENSINDKLDGVKVKLFKISKSGTVKNIFTVTHEGIDFARMNNAKQINAGISLLNFVQEAKGISLPIFVDNAESVNHLQQTNSQTLELYVSEKPLEVI